MNHTLVVTKIIKRKNRIEYNYDLNGKWENLISKAENMYIEYDENVENIPDSIAIIPFLCNVLPISWVFDLTINVCNLDSEFYGCLSDVKAGYQQMYPSMTMKGALNFQNLEANVYKAEKNATLFSGGVDAFNTLFRHIEASPYLVTLWGADIDLSDIEGWNLVKEYHKVLSKQLNLKCCFIKTNFRNIMNYENLSKYINRYVVGGWWHEFQHGIGILGHVAPLAYLYKFRAVYIASSYTPEYKGSYTCASDPIIDNFLRFANCIVIHDSYEVTRQQKIKNICNYTELNLKDNIRMRVCWENVGGENCCECEKCYRTIMGIIAEKKDPKKYGFNLTPKKKIKMMKKIKKFVKYNHVCAYKDIQNRFLENYSIEDTPTDLMWFRKINIKNRKKSYILLLEKVKNKIIKIWKKI